MLPYLQTKHLIGLALAIASGLILAHIATKTGDYLFDYYPAQFAQLALVALAVVVVYLAAKQRGAIARWIAGHRRGLTYSGVAVLLAFCAFAVRAVTLERHQAATAAPSQPAVYLDDSGNPVQQQTAVAAAKRLQLQKLLSGAAAQPPQQHPTR